MVVYLSDTVNLQGGLTFLSCHSDRPCAKYTQHVSLALFCNVYMVCTKTWWLRFLPSYLSRLPDLENFRQTGRRGPREGRSSSTYCIPSLSMSVSLLRRHASSDQASSTTSPYNLAIAASLPIPTAPSLSPPTTTKKSHARKQPIGHIPRPRNAFILFRCDLVRQGKIPGSIEQDPNNISRIAGSIWRGMTEEQKAPWVEMARREKEEHGMKYPPYRFNALIDPGTVGRTRRGKSKMGGGKPDEVSSHNQRDDDTAEPLQEPPPQMESVMQFSDLRSLSRTPPGAILIPVLPVGKTPDGKGMYGIPYTTQDPAVFAHRCLTSGLPAAIPSAVQEMTSAPSLDSLDCTPASLSVLENGPYVMAPPGDSPGWDCAQPVPYVWQSSSNVQLDDSVFNFVCITHHVLVRNIVLRSLHRNSCRASSITLLTRQLSHPLTCLIPCRRIECWMRRWGKVRYESKNAACKSCRSHLCNVLTSCIWARVWK